MTNRHPRVAFSLFFLFFLLGWSMGLARNFAFINDGDTWWHISAGLAITDAHLIPPHDLWSFTAGDYSWLNISWLYDVGLNALYEWKGILGINIATSLISATSLGLIAFFAYQLTRSFGCALIAAGVSMMFVHAFTIVRPQLIIFPLLIISHLILRLYAHTRWVYILPFISLLWVNIHGSFFVLFFLIGSYGLDALMRRDLATFFKLLTIGIISFAALFLNPVGIHIFEASMRSINSLMAPYISEWQPATLKFSIGMWLYMGLFLFISQMHNTRIPLADRLIAFVWFILPFYTGRYLVISAIVCMPYIAQSLYYFTRNSAFAHFWIRKDFSFMRDLSQPTAHLILFIVFCGLAFCTAYSPVRAAIGGTKQYAEYFAPDQEINYILAHYPDEKFLNNYDFGGYIVYKTRGKLPVFIDGRADTAFPPEVIKDYLTFAQPGYSKNETKPDEPPDKPLPPASTNDWWYIVDKYKLGGFMVPRGGFQDVWLSHEPRLVRVFSGKQASVFVLKKLARSPEWVE